MNCTHCNAELPEGAKVCEYCDCAVETKDNGKLMRIIVGGLYGLAAILLIYVVKNVANAALSGLLQSSYAYGSAYVAAYSVLSRVVYGFDNVIYPAAGLMMAVASLALLLKKKGAWKAAFIGGIAGIAAVGCSLIMQIFLQAFPKDIASLFITSPEIVEVIVNLVRNEKAISNHFIISAVITATAVVPAFVLTLLFRKKESADSTLCGKMERSTASLIVFLPLFVLALRVRNLISTAYTGMLGQDALIADTAVSNITEMIFPISAALLLTITVYCVLMKKYKYALFILPGLGTIILNGIVSLCTYNTVAQNYLYGYSEEILAMVSKAVLPKCLGAFFLLIAVYFWIAATARGGVRAWGQIIFAVSFIFFAIILEAMKAAVFALGIGVPLTEIVLGNAMLAASIPLSIRKREL